MAFAPRRLRSRLFAASLIMSGLLLLLAQFALNTWMTQHQVRRYDSDLDSISLARIQGLAEASGKTVFLGSSQSERLLPTHDVVTMGVPGSPFSTAWEYYFPMGHYPQGSLLLLEANWLMNPPNQGFIADTQAPYFRWAAGSPILSMEARPSALILSFALHHVLRMDARQHDARCLPQVQAPDERPARELPQSPEFEATYAERLASILEMRAAGYRPALIFLPTNYNNPADMCAEEQRLDIARSLAKDASIPLLHYDRATLPLPLRFSDTHHLQSLDEATILLRNSIIRDAKAAYTRAKYARAK